MREVAELMRRHPRWFVLTGAGVSTLSGIPDYRDESGEWKRPQPVRYAEFMSQSAVRRRYWSRSLVGWPMFRAARPGEAHHALAELERRGLVGMLITQNVDRLHQQAGGEQVVDLHGRLDEVVCQSCAFRFRRDEMQRELEMANPSFARLDAVKAPDGDADLSGLDLTHFRVPDCPSCGGILKPDVVFFGERVPPERVEIAFEQLERADGVLVVGSSLMVWSGFRFAREAARQGKPLVAINRGRTRADELLTLKVDQECGAALSDLLRRLAVDTAG